MEASAPQSVLCPPPTRARQQDQAVELFLHAWQHGRFTCRLHWLPQNRCRVGIVAEDDAGRRVALAYAALPVPDENLEPLLAPLAGALDRDGRLDLPGRGFDLRFRPALLTKALRRGGAGIVQALAAGLCERLPHLPSGRRSSTAIPIPLPSGKSGRIRVDVEIRPRADGARPVSLSICRPCDPECLRPILRTLLARELPRLAASDAEHRILLLDLPAPGGQWRVIDTVREWAGRFPLLERVNRIVVADTSAFASGAVVTFWVWDRAALNFTEILRPAISAPPAAIPAGWLASLARQAREFAAAAKSANTLRAYAADWNDFRQWCEVHAAPALPAAPETVAFYLTDRSAILKTSSLARRLTTINRAHEAAGHPSPATMRNPVVAEVWKGIRRTKGTAGAGKRPFLTADLKKISGELPPGLQGIRDRALLLVGFAGGFRRSELARLRIEDLKDTAEGMVATLRRSKTDQEGLGRPVALPYGSDPLTCPVRAVRAWMEAAGLSSGPLFRGVDQFGLVSDRALCPDSVAWIVKRAAGRARLSTMEYSGHSLRAGLATQAAMNGAGEFAIMKQTGHRSLATVRRYIRDGALFRDNAATKLGL